MSNSRSVTLSLAGGSDSEYIIRDKAGITIGRVFIIEMSKVDEHCCFRIKLYRVGKESHEYIKDSLTLMLLSLFKNMKVNKVSVITDEDINIGPFIELGFRLEGVLSDNSVVNNEYKDEFIFGIDHSSFQGSSIKKKLTLEGRKIELRILTPENAEELLQYYERNKEHLEPFEPTRDKKFYTLETQKKDLIENYKHYLNGTGLTFGIFSKDKLIGKIRVSNIVMGVFKNAFVGYSVDKDEQGKGYMTEAVRLVTDYCFKDMGLHRIEATTLVDNVKSQAVLMHCGFKEIGTCEKYLFINGEWRDHKIFYKVNEE